MADQPASYLDLLEEIASIGNSRSRAKEFARLSERIVKRNDTVELLMLGELAARRAEWQPAAQLFSLTIVVSSFSAQYSEADLIGHVKQVLLLTSGHEPELESAADLSLYCHRRLTSALRHDGMQQSEANEWAVYAFSHLLDKAQTSKSEIRDAIAQFDSGANRISKCYKSQIGLFRNLLSCSLSLPTRDERQTALSQRAWKLVLFWVAVGVIAVVSGLFGHLFPLPVGSFLERIGVGPLLRAAYLAWPLLLLVTWLFALSESLRTETFRYISPAHLFGPHGITTGEIVPFGQDWFFHVFQFVWIALLLIAWMLFSAYRDLPDWLQTVWSSSAPTSFGAFKDSLAVQFWPHSPTWGGIWSTLMAIFASDFFALFAAIVLALTSILLQRHIQKDRDRTGTDFYWWDRRVNPTEWRIRLTMVAIDLFLASFLLVKILMTLFAAYVLVTTNALRISYFSPDGVGGLKNLTDILMYLSWVVFLFGIFVVASLYLHWNLREYRRFDLALICVYVLFLALMVAPLGILNSKFSTEKDRIVQSLASASSVSGQKMSDAAKYVDNLKSLDGWSVSATKVGILSNPVLPLSFQLVVILIQILGRAGKLPKWLISLAGEKFAPEGGHDTH